MLATTEQMRELDRTAIEERGIPSLELMENAAREVAQAVDLPILGMGGVSKGEDAAQLRAYLETHLRPGETAELWNLWVSDIRVRAFRLTGPLADLDADALVQMAEREQTCITLTI